jgi:hypothetical protein
MEEPSLPLLLLLLLSSVVLSGDPQWYCSSTLLGMRAQQRHSCWVVGAILASASESI